MASQVTNAKKRKNKAAPVKTSLNSPYEYHWSPPDRDDAHFILNKLKEKMAQLGFRKRETRDKTPRAQRSAEDQETPCRDDRTESGWTDEAARRQLAIGINEVTKGLERNELRLVLVCNSVKPPHMTQHLIPLSESRAVPACQLPRLSSSLAGPLGLRCVLALGFRLGPSVFADVVETIAPRVPVQGVSWLPRAAELRPLKVKKIVPNPDKVRKPKKKRGARAALS